MSQYEEYQTKRLNLYAAYSHILDEPATNLTATSPEDDKLDVLKDVALSLTYVESALDALVDTLLGDPDNDREGCVCGGECPCQEQELPDVSPDISKAQAILDQLTNPNTFGPMAGYATMPHLTLLKEPVEVTPDPSEQEVLKTRALAELRQAMWEAHQFISTGELDDYTYDVVKEIASDED